MFNKIFKKPVRTLIILLASFLFVGLIIDQLGITKKWLTVNKPVNSNFYVIEGWITPNYYDSILKILNNSPKKILITGTLSSDRITTYRNGYLIIKKLLPDSVQGKCNIEIEMSGEKVNGIWTLANIYHNNELIQDSIIIKKKTSYTFSIDYKPNDSLSVRFINDQYNNYNDRNLSITSIKINNKRKRLHSEDVWILNNDMYVNTNARSNSEGMAKNLIALGIPDSCISFINTESKGELSKTYHMASSAIKWLKRNGYNSATIITMDYHSRRTYISYKKSDPDFNIGVISLPVITYRSKVDFKLRTIKEVFGSIILHLIPKRVLDTKF